MRYPDTSVRMIETPLGRFINYPSLYAAYEGQRERSKLRVAGKYIPKLDKIFSYIEDELPRLRFRWRHFGLNASSPGVLGIFDHLDTTYMTRIFLTNLREGVPRLIVDTCPDNRVQYAHDVVGFDIKINDKVSGHDVMLMLRDLHQRMIHKYNNKIEIPK